MGKEARIGRSDAVCIWKTTENHIKSAHQPQVIQSSKAAIVEGLRVSGTDTPHPMDHKRDMDS